MKRNVSVEFFNHSGKTITTILPEICPHCGKTMSPITYRGYCSKNTHDSDLNIGIMAQCSSTGCQKYFVYHNFFNYNLSEDPILKTDSYRPPILVSLPDNIEKVSPIFLEIYSQATKAETESLDQIAGVGYRKALEFLIKDYAIRTNPDKQDAIEKALLGSVIGEYLKEFKKLQNLAKAATWIGNDETHYVRRHDDKDIRDMKQFIKSAAQFIAADYDADIADDFISGNKS